MKKYSPYIFPLIVVVIVFFLVYRWYTVRTQRDASQAGYGEGIQIENLTPDQQKSVLKGSPDVSSVPLEPTASDTNQPTGKGDIRYQIKDNKVTFSVSADLPTDKEYHVWVRSKDGDNLTEAFTLKMEKGGLMGSAVVPQSQLPLEVIVSQATNKADVLNQVIMKGMIENKGAQEQNK